MSAEARLQDWASKGVPAHPSRIPAEWLLAEMCHKAFPLCSYKHHRQPKVTGTCLLGKMCGLGGCLYTKQRAVWVVILPPPLLDRRFGTGVSKGSRDSSFSSEIAQRLLLLHLANGDQDTWPQSRPWHPEGAWSANTTLILAADFALLLQMHSSCLRFQRARSASSFQWGH